MCVTYYLSHTPCGHETFSCTSHCASYHVRPFFNDSCPSPRGRRDVIEDVHKQCSMCESENAPRGKSGLVPKHSLAKPGSTPPHVLDPAAENGKTWREEKDESYKTPSGVLGPKDIGLEPGRGSPLTFGKSSQVANKKFSPNRKQSIIAQKVAEEKEDEEREEEYDKTLEELTAEVEGSESESENQLSTKRNTQMDWSAEDRPKNQASTKRKAELQMPFADQPPKKIKVTNFQGMDPDLKRMAEKHQNAKQGTDGGKCCVQ